MTSNAPSLRRAAARRPVFQLWGWAMLVVVLLCSAAASGQPRTRIVGSAFDPTTTSVALNPKQPRVAAKTAKSAKSKLPGEEVGAALPLAAIAGRPELIVDTADAGRPNHPALAETAASRIPVRPLGARAPPQA